MEKYFHKANIGLCMLIMLTTQTLAQQATDTLFSRTLEPVSVYALKAKANTKSIRLTTADWVQHDAGQLLSQISGFSTIRKSGGFAFDPVFRGFKLEQLNILSDGALTAHAACPNRMDPPTSQVMINQVQEVEIMKGPHNFRFGPSSGAVINFKTAGVQFSEKNTTYGRVSAGMESNGRIKRTEGMWGLRSKKLQLSLAGSYSKGKDYKDGNDSVISAFFNRGALNMAVNYKVTDKQVASVNITRNFARNVSFPVLMMDLLSDDTWMIQGKYAVQGTGKWFSQWNTQIFTSLVDHQMGNRLRPASASMLTHVFANTQTSGARTEFTVKKNALQLFAGADMKYEYANGQRTRSMLTGPMAGKTFRDTLWQQGTIQRTGIFAHLQHRFGKNDVSVSGRMDLVQSRPQQSASRYKTEYSQMLATDINPSLSVGLVRKLSSEWSAGAWLGRGVRSAGITEKFINFLPVGMDAYEVIGNPQLKPESNTQFDLMVQYKKEGTLMQVAGYASRVDNYISSVILAGVKPMVSSAPGVRRFINLDQALFTGFELTWHQQLGKIISNEFSAFYTKGQNRDLDQPLPEINPFELKNKLQARLLKDRISSYINYRHAFRQDRVSQAFGERTTAAFTVVDLGVKTLFVPGMQVSLAVQNLFNVAYKEHLSRYIRPTLPLNAPGRSLVLMASWEF